MDVEYRPEHLTKLSGKGAFSLVELSIVLVILGLLTGGILSGQSLIRAAELRGVTTEYQRYLAAIHTFRDKYLTVPGDFKDATKFWGRQVNAAHCATNSGAAVGSPGTCDGNGGGTMTNASGASVSGEEFQFWRQLALAGLIEGTFDGIAGTNVGTDAVIGTNVPRSKLGNAGWSVSTWGAPSGNTNAYYGDYGSYFLFGAKLSGNNVTLAPILRPEEAWNIDTKLDDGKPAYGRIMGRFWNNLCGAADDGNHTNSNLAASYKVSDSSIQCALYFTRVF